MDKIFKLLSLLLLLFICFLLLSGEYEQFKHKNEIANVAVFTKEKIPKVMRIGMDDHTKLSLLTVTYINYEDEAKIGNIIIHKDLAAETLEIFETLYNEKFPIYQIKLLTDFNNNDLVSMENNNTYAYANRLIEGSAMKLSNHAKGIAIDINPMQNPYLYKNLVYPAGSDIYLTRNKDIKGIITKESLIYKTFTAHGWTWGGDFTYPDYHHFEKRLH